MSASLPIACKRASRCQWWLATWKSASCCSVAAPVSRAVIRSWATSPGVGWPVARACSRTSRPYAAYLPPGSEARVTADSPAEIAVCTSPGNPLASEWLPPRLIEPASMARSTRGKGANTRYVCDILPDTAAAHSLLVVEVRTPSGHSSSYPPHRHDRDNLPEESLLEESYYHRIDPGQGFVFQRVYTDERDLDQAMAVEDHDVVLVPRGYHPVSVPYGYESYYLNVMAGPKRIWKFHNDPQHEWLLTR
ncbi:5-deoxy-glucuronate isomerase [Pseudomonas psychrotolerans]|nr:5-deoxy-glucuronate isomerase [Pseudomonas psychrotolerans]